MASQSPCAVTSPEDPPATTDADQGHRGWGRSNHGKSSSSPRLEPPPPPGLARAGQTFQSPAASASATSFGKNDAPPSLEATLSPPLGQFVVNITLQVAGFVAAVAFGVFAIKSVRMADTSNRYAAQALEQSIVANRLAMLSVCLSAMNAVS